MDSIRIFYRLLLGFVFLLSLVPQPLHAAPPAGRQPLVQPEVSSDTVTWKARRTGLQSWQLRLSPPDREEMIHLTFDGSAPSLSLGRLAELLGTVPEGVYTYEISATPNRAGVPRHLAREFRQSGSFHIAGGRFVYDETAVDPAEADGSRSRPGDALRIAGVPTPDGDHQTFDTTSPFGFVNGFGVRDSLCVGAACQTQVDYGDDVIRLVESNLRIGFEDTTDPADPFPTRDWEILVNDNTSGGLDRFSIHDVTSGLVPLTVEGGAPSDTLWVDDLGRVGVGTSTPAQRLHVQDGDTPVFRLEQDTTQGFANRAWELAGNEGEFFLRDVTSTLAPPLRVEAGTPRDTLVLTDQGFIGSGTDAPTASFHLFGADGGTELLIEEANATEAGRVLLELANNGSVSAWFTDTSPDGNTWRLRNQDNGFVIGLNDSGVTGFRVDGAGSIYAANALWAGVKQIEAAPADRAIGNFRNRGGVILRLEDVDGETWDISNLTNGLSFRSNGQTQLLVNQAGDLTIQGTLTQNSNRESKTNIRRVDPLRVLDQVAGLPISTWERKGQPETTHLGPMAQDFRASFGLGTNDTSLATLDLAGVALAAIQGLHAKNEELERENRDLRQAQAELETRLEALERQLSNTP